MKPAFRIVPSIAVVCAARVAGVETCHAAVSPTPTLTLAQKELTK